MMTREEINSYNASYFGIPVVWMEEHNKFMGMRPSEWPQSLTDFCTEVSSRIGWCGDVAGCAVADWMKQEKATGRL